MNAIHLGTGTGTIPASSSQQKGELKEVRNVSDLRSTESYRGSSPMLDVQNTVGCEAHRIDYSLSSIRCSHICHDLGNLLDRLTRNIRTDNESFVMRFINPISGIFESVCSGSYLSELGCWIRGSASRHTHIHTYTQCLNRPRLSTPLQASSASGSCAFCY